MTTDGRPLGYREALKQLESDLEAEKLEAPASEKHEICRESFSDLTHWNSFVCVDPDGQIWGWGKNEDVALHEGTQDARQYFEQEGHEMPTLQVIPSAIMLMEICSECGGSAVSYEIIDGVAYPAEIGSDDWANYRFVPQASFSGRPLVKGKWVWVERTL